MIFRISAFDHERWERYGLAEFGTIADMISECNMGEDAFSGFGEWFYIPENPLPNKDMVIYCGTWGNDHSPGASSYTDAELFDENQKEEYEKRVSYWQLQPEYLPEYLEYLEESGE